ncbi:PAS domain-containing sensor histidine kinase [Natrinema halophilum]|uniref:histidine kinase n=1 Tax=Natrinema halophilum TaxID=1699371 RepID=A0A7D5KE92_9EURY|nr:PAS domain-containing sensor histidine kinase [Natrinema halophilum]QLG50041.1 PAS domain S-box protein [Natrinema halophilum]
MESSIYEHIFENTAARIAVHEPDDARFTRVNRAYADALGYAPSVLEGRSLAELASQEATALTAAIERALDGESEQIETGLIADDGSTLRVTFELETIAVDGQRRLLSTLRSVADRDGKVKPTPSDRRLEIALSGTNTGIWEWDMETDEVIWTPSMERLFRVEPGTFEGTFEGFAKRVHPDDLSDVQGAIETAIERDEMFQTEYRIQRDDGVQRWVHARGELKDAADGPGRIVGIVTDITEQKETQQELRKQERRYRQLVERLPDAHYTMDSEYRITFCNEALANRLGLTVEETQGEVIWDLLPEAEGTVAERTFQEVMETGTPQNFEYQYESGEWVSVQVYPYENGIAAVSTDITDQREALVSILDTTPIVLYRFDSDGIFQEARGDMLEELGLEPDDLIGESIFEFYGDNEHVTAAARRALEGESFRYTLTLGDITLETKYKPVYADGEVTSVIGVSTDVTELHRQRERMEFFNSILRHDVLNGMTVIKMRAELLADELDSDLEQYAQTIIDWCDTTTEVTRRVRKVIETLTTPDEEHDLEPVDVSSILERKLGKLDNAYPSVEFESAVPADVRVRADSLLTDVLGNVLSNSIEHNDETDLRITTTVEPDDDIVRIRIADNGRGIADDRKQSVFRRGETSHAKETGSGFGLFFVDVMIEKYGGEVWIEDSDTGGARFVIELTRDWAEQ